MTRDDLLFIDDVHTYYGESHILYDVTLSVQENDVVALLGRNGMGKTTLMRSITGIQPPRSGTIWYRGEDITDLPIHERSRRGISLVPQERRIFPNLTVEENLNLANVEEDDAWTIQDIYELFPRIEEREGQDGYSLSGGEQQMLSVSRALLQNTDLLLLDEPFEGLAPIIIDDLSAGLQTIVEENVTVLIAAQILEEALALADQSYILEDGGIVYEGDASELLADEQSQRQHLGITETVAE
jgi:branched-chain amino acid transport system ATP-binding protein